ncbi:MAG: SDR family NAD(P)-dependent oxidoreductase, partial [Solirubrobacteraceae bacterium]
ATNAAVEGTLSGFGKIDILLVSHGLLPLSPVADMSDAIWDDVISSDLTGVFKSIRAVIPHMVAAKSGRIIATASMAGRTGLPTVADYCAAKWGVIGPDQVGRPRGRRRRRHRELRLPDQPRQRHDPQRGVLRAVRPRYREADPGTSHPRIRLAQRDPDPVDRGDRHLQQKCCSWPRRRRVTSPGEALHVSAGWNAFNAA